MKKNIYKAAFAKKNNMTIKVWFENILRLKNAIKKNASMHHIHMFKMKSVK